jgi:hypothetical protein
MAEKQNPQASDSGDSSGSPRRSGHHTDVRDAIAELAERAEAISHEAGTRVASAMKGVISAATGIAGFAIESARDLVQYMVRRGQMTPEEGEKLIRDAEAAHHKRHPAEKARPTAGKVAGDRFGPALVKPVAPTASAKASSHSSEKSAKPSAKPDKGGAGAGTSGKPVKTVKSAKPGAPAKPAVKDAKKRK